MIRAGCSPRCSRQPMWHGLGSSTQAMRRACSPRPHLGLQLAWRECLKVVVNHVPPVPAHASQHLCLAVAQLAHNRLQDCHCQAAPACVGRLARHGCAGCQTAGMAAMVGCRAGVKAAGAGTADAACQRILVTVLADCNRAGRKRRRRAAAAMAAMRRRLGTGRPGARPWRRRRLRHKHRSMPPGALQPVPCCLMWHLVVIGNQVCRWVVDWPIGRSGFWVAAGAMHGVLRSIQHVAWAPAGLEISRSCHLPIGVCWIECPLRCIATAVMRLAVPTDPSAVWSLPPARSPAASRIRGGLHRICSASLVGHR
eukprot:240341-Chlamydomonas_euryale.AAC.8